ncbi:MAG: ATP-binding protein [Candidatus Neomarinimicrobiota bacterium]
MIILLTSSLTVFVVDFFQRWRADVISSNSVLTEIVARQLQHNFNTLNSPELIDHLLNDLPPDRKYLARLDSILQQKTAAILREIEGMEGGYYLGKFDEFLGYAYPTLPPPKPVYGPPPRSYAIIKAQVLRSIDEQQIVVDLHQFDPAVFPLTTGPLIIAGRTVGGVWTRVHIERKLPAYRLRESLNIIATVSLIGFLLASLVFMVLRNRTRNIRVGLENIQRDPSYRLKIQGGTYGFIADSINKLVDTIDRENRNLQRMERDLHQQDKLASLGKLIAGVAHEVKTPLAIIKTRVQLWQQQLEHVSPTNDRSDIFTPESLNLVVAEINRLTKLVNRLLIFSKPVNTNLMPVSINAVLQETVELLKPHHGRIEFDTSFTDGSDLVLGDQQALKQVFLNVLSNSIQAAAESGPIVITTENIIDGQKIRISIIDSGPGITAEVLPKIFDPFYTTREQGVGLGLSIAYEIIQAHDGTIEIRNKPGGGVICEISIPLHNPNSKHDPDNG